MQVRHGVFQFLHIVVQREKLLNDALAQIVRSSTQDLKKQLVVHFVSNGVMEEGVDAGGVTKVARHSLLIYPTPLQLYKARIKRQLHRACEDPHEH